MPLRCRAHRRRGRVSFLLPVETHEIHPDNHKRDTEPLAHVQRHVVLKVHLVFFQELDEETEGENLRQAESEEETAVIGQGASACKVVDFRLVVLKSVSSLLSCFFCPRLYSQTIPKKKMK